MSPINNLYYAVAHNPAGVMIVDPPISKSVHWISPHNDTNEVETTRELRIGTTLKEPARSQKGAKNLPWQLGSHLPYGILDTLSLDRSDWDSWDDLTPWSSWTPSTIDGIPDEPMLPAFPRSMPQLGSTYVDISQLYASGLHSSTETALCCMELGRRIVLTMWAAYLRDIEEQVMDVQWEMSVGSTKFDGIDMSNWLETAWTLPWKNRTFSGFVRAKSHLELCDVHIEHNMKALHIGGSKSIASDWEVEQWEWFQLTVTRLKKKVDILCESYTQAVSSNEARSVDFLTSLATIFVPISLVAGILSMGGDFAAGQDKFWVFWVVAVPLILLGVVLIFTGFLRLLRNGPKRLQAAWASGRDRKSTRPKKKRFDESREP
jgi:hypothetical protein